MRRFHQRVFASLRFRAVAYFVLLISLVPASVVFWRVRHNVQFREQARFHAVTEKVEAAVRDNLEGLTADLLALSGFFEANGALGRDEWRTFIARLELERRHPGIRSVGFSERVTADTAAEFVTRLRKEVGPDFDIFPRPISSLAFPTVYVTQFPTNIDARLGWDSYSEALRRRALTLVMETGRPAITGKTRYWNYDGRETEGFTIFVPVPAKAGSTNSEIRGAIFSSFIPQHLFNNFPRSQFDRAVSVELFDGGTAHAARSLAGFGVAAEPAVSARRESVLIHLLDHVFLLRITARPEFDTFSEKLLPWIVLACGLGFSFLLFGITWTQASSRAAAEKLNQRLRNSEDQLRATNAELERKISDATTAEGLLAKEKELLAVTLRSIADGVITTDVQGRIVLFNEVAGRLTGWKSSEAIGRPLNEVFETKGAGTDRDILRSGLDEVAAQPGRDAVLVVRDGVERNISQSVAPIIDHAGQKIGAVLVFRDVTEKVQSEAETQRASKLESIGVLAGGIAHDFNNILTVILGNISLARMFDTSGGSLADALLEAEKASLRARELTQRLLTFARGGAPIKKPLDLSSLVRECAARTLQGTDVVPEFFVGDDLWSVEADESQIHQVVQNLVSYARASVSKDPRLDIHVLNQEIASDPLLLLRPGKYLRISIRDYGTGIQSENLTKIFDPYFGGKKQGSGLELATAYSIVRKHEGQIRVESISGHGTVFHIYLPATEAALAARRATPQREIQFQPRRILVMDDELPIRKLAVLSLQRIGCTAATAADGAEAIDLYEKARQAGEPFDAVIMDLTVPNGMGGKETIPQLRAINPDVLAIVSSGYSNDPVMANYRDYGFAGVVPKPYSTEDLAAALDELFSNGVELQTDPADGVVLK
jgi:PAS domain S-box-containing protein